jgi:hypothetical protein
MRRRGCLLLSRAPPLHPRAIGNAPPFAATTRLSVSGFAGNIQWRVTGTPERAGSIGSSSPTGPDRRGYRRGLPMALVGSVPGKEFRSCKELGYALAIGLLSASMRAVLGVRAGWAKRLTARRAFVVETARPIGWVTASRLGRCVLDIRHNDGGLLGARRLAVPIDLGVTQRNRGCVRLCRPHENWAGMLLAARAYPSVDTLVPLPVVSPILAPQPTTDAERRPTHCPIPGVMIRPPTQSGQTPGPPLGVHTSPRFIPRGHCKGPWRDQMPVTVRQRLSRNPTRAV